MMELIVGTRRLRLVFEKGLEWDLRVGRNHMGQIPNAADGLPKQVYPADCET